MTARYSIHPLARAVPPMTEEEFAALKADIASQGQLEPAWVYESAILDGIHRQKACAELGLPLKTREYTGTAPAAFVIAMNVKRRHLSVGQQSATGEAMVRHYQSKHPKNAGANLTAVARDLGLADVYERSDTSNRPATADLVATAIGIPAQAIETFATLRKQTPELAREVAAGTKALYTADAERKQAAKVSPEGRSVVKPRGESRDEALDEYLGAIRAVGVKQNVLVMKRREITGQKDFVAGAQDKLERVTAAGRRLLESL